MISAMVLLGIILVIGVVAAVVIAAVIEDSKNSKGK
jgi:hypothetical protein